jgi:Flp pilus assembly protein TadG
MSTRVKGFMADQSGAMATTVALVMVVLLAMAALVIDYGHMAWVQNELKAAADAGAMAGARALVPYTGIPPNPNWTAAQTSASHTALLNRADAQSITDCDVTYGYWSLTAKTLPLQSFTITPTAADVPAVRVVIAKSTGHNSGPLHMFFASIFGVNTTHLNAQAVAMISFPAGMPKGSMFPLAAAKNIVDLYWKQVPPVSFKIGSESANGQWTSFKVDNGGASYVDGLIAHGNPDTLKVNENIYIQTGVVASNYGNAASCIGKTVVIALADISKNPTPVLGFVAFNIEAVSQGSKYIQGHFDKNFNIDNAALVGPPTPDTLSTPNPPKLVY